MPVGVYVRTAHNLMNVGIANKKRCKDKTWEQLYGVNKATVMKKSLIESLSRPWEERMELEKAKEVKQQFSDDRHYLWKGDAAKKGAIHDWIRRNWGKADHCTNPNCLGKSTRFDWSKKDHNTPYTRNIDEYQQICKSCHQLYDRCKLMINGRYGW